MREYWVVVRCKNYQVSPGVQTWASHWLHTSLNEDTHLMKEALDIHVSLWKIISLCSRQD
jgi:hypothetical protein